MHCYLSSKINFDSQSCSILSLSLLSLFFVPSNGLSIGLDTCLAIQQTLYHGTGDSKYRPSVLLERMVDAQWLGKKSGKGFYDYTN